MDTRQLRAFLQVCEYGSILRTSQNIFISQQALSKTIASLEKEVGLPLFRRTSRGLILTETGEQLRELARPVVDAMDHLHEQIAVSAKLKSSHLKLGISSSLQYFFNHVAVSRFAAEHAPIEVSMEELPYYVCEQQVRAGELTAALISGPADSTGLKVIRLTERQRIAIVPKASQLAKKKLISIRDFKGANLVTNINNRCHDKFCALCSEVNIKPNISRVSDNSTLFELCNDLGYVGIGIDFFLLKPSPEYENIIALPINPEEFIYPIDLIVNPSQFNRKIVQTLVEYICDRVSAKDKSLPQYPHQFINKAP